MFASVICGFRSVSFVVFVVACWGCGLSMPIHCQVSERQGDLPARAEATGSIAGHVYCGDIKVPARLASVTIQSVASVGMTKDPPDPDHLPVVIRTDMDGKFTLSGVTVGKYVVVAWLPGYLSPLARLADETDQFRSPSEGFKHRLEQLVPSVTVEANQTSSVEIRLERGAEISGTISFDDGGPVVGAEVELLQQTKDAEWRVVPLINSLVQYTHDNTDDRGHFRLVGVPPGTFIVTAVLPLQTFGGAAIDRGSVRYAVPRTLNGRLEVYSGDTLRRTQARSTKIVTGETRPGVDITIPLSKLRSITGVLVAANDGHRLKIGLIQLLYADDMSLAQRSHAERDGTFVINFVTDGDYILRVVGGPLDGEDASQERGSTAGHRNYKGIDIPLSVHGDVSNLVVASNE